jgi:hypothetical protein
LLPDEFWGMTLEEVSIACKGYERRKAKEKEVERLVATILLNVYRGEDNPPYLPEDVFPLVIDKERVNRLITKDEYQTFNDTMDKVIWQRN